jgi:hypothetical protein
VKKQLLILLIVVMSVVMAVFIGIQVYWIKNSLQLREANFKRSVDDAVNVALSYLETIELSKRTTNSSLQLLAHDSNSLLVNAGKPENSLDADTQGIKMAKPAGIETGSIAIPGKTAIVGGDEDKKVSESLKTGISKDLAEGAAVRKQIMLNYMMNQTLGQQWQ